MAVRFEAILVREVVGRLTDHAAFQYFYFEFLMAENEAARAALGQKFMERIENAPKDEQADLRAEWSRCFLRLPKMVKDLHQRAGGAMVAA